MRRLSWILLPLAAVLAFAAWPYLLSPAYLFPNPQPFHGAAWYNPYSDTTGTWLTANFHAHSHAWGGVTNGRLAPDSVHAIYASLGHDIAPVTNYFRLDATGDAITAYEHGLNLFKSHRLVIGAERVDWLDFALGQSRAHKQYMIERLARDGVVAIPHPYMRDGHTPDDLRHLTGYHLLEVTSHYGNAERHWDAALTAGRPVWAIANDDTHDANDVGQTGVRWTLVRSSSGSRDDVLAALRAGRTVAVKGRGAVMPVAIDAVEMRGDTLLVQLDRTVRRIDFIGAEGRRLASVASTAHARYVAQPSDPYVRVVVSVGQTVLYLNPMVRTDAGIPQVAAAKFDVPVVWASRLTLLGFIGVTALWSTTPRRRRRRPVAVPANALRREA